MKRTLATLALLALPLFAMPAQVAAAGPLTTFAACGAGASNFLGLQTWDACLRNKYGGQVKITHFNDIWLIVLPIIDDILKIGVYIAAGLIIWAGFQYIKSNGEPSKTTAAKDTILNAVIGLIITLLAVAIVEFIAGRF